MTADRQHCQPCGTSWYGEPEPCWLCGSPPALGPLSSAFKGYQFEQYDGHNSQLFTMEEPA